MQKKAILFFLSLCMLLLILKPTYAVCTGTLEKETYYPLESPVVTFICDAVNEKNTAYNIQWWNGTHIVRNISGTTPALQGTAFFDTYQIPSGSTWTNANVSLIGTNLEGGDWFNVTGASATSLSMNNWLTTEDSNNGVWIGEIFGVQFSINNYLNKSISNAKCIVSLEDGNNIPIMQKAIRKVFIYVH